MKNTFLILVLLLSQLAFCQKERKHFNDTLINFCNKSGSENIDLFKWSKKKSKNGLKIDSTKSFSISPMSKRTNRVDGIVLGFGHLENRKIASQTINGLNIEANPAPAAGALMAFLVIMHMEDVVKNIFKNNNDIKNDLEPKMEIKNWSYTPELKMNGVNLSTGCFFTTTNMYGLNISLANKFKNFEGLSIAPLGIIVDNQKGLSIGILNLNNTLAGSAIGIYNQSYLLKGVQIGGYNKVKIDKGLQIGLINRSYSKGFQLGVWNKNAKRSLPILNW